MTHATLLSELEIQYQLSLLPGWTRHGEAITKRFTFATFPAGIAFIGRVSEVAEAQQHHPDIDIRYTTITFTLSTHDSGGITAKDVALASDIEQQVKAL
ncbi:4a-hydroxytetrahydrobiopterin dehydratase [Gemmatimonas sp.]